MSSNQEPNPYVTRILGYINAAENNHMAQVHKPMAAAFGKAVKNRAKAYDEQAKFEQIGTDLLVITSIALLTMFVPIAATGAAAGNTLARSWAKKMVRSGATMSTKQLRALGETSWSKIFRFGYQGFSHSSDTFVGAFTAVGAKVTSDVAGYSYLMLRLKGFGQKAREFSTPDSDLAKVQLDPHYYGSNLAKYMNNHFAAMRKFIGELENDSTITETMWVDLLEGVKSSWLMEKPQPVAENIIERKFELLFYMHDLMSGDTTDIIEMRMRKQPDGPWINEPTVVGQRDIATSPSSPFYPTQGVNTFDPGVKVGKNINRLYKEVIGLDDCFRKSNPDRGEDFFDNWLMWNDVDRAVLIEAEKCLAELIFGTNPTF